MPRPKSIPNDLIFDILEQHLNGMSSQEITDWILETNPLRKEPVQTSRASVDRVVEGVMGEDSDYPLVGTIRLLQRNAPRFLQQLEQIEGEYERLLLELVPLPTVAEQRKAQVLLTSRLKVLATQERILVRKLRLAGVGGAGGLAAMKSYASDLVKCNERRRNDPVRAYAAWNFQDEPPAGADERQPPDTTGEPARNDPSNRLETPVHEGMKRADASGGSPGREEPRPVPPAAPRPAPSATPARNDPSNRPGTPVHEGMKRADLSRGSPGQDEPRPAPSATPVRNDPSNRPETPVHEGMKRADPSREPPASPARHDASPPPRDTRPPWMVKGWGTGK